MNRNDVERLYDQFALGIFRYLVALLGDVTTARDLLQDVFVKLARNGQCLEGVGDVKAFVFRIARNAAVDWVRRAGVRRRAVESLRVAAGEVFAAAADPDAKEFQTQLAGALQALPEDQRGTVYLKLWEGMTFVQISEATGEPANTVASRYRYGIEKLRERLRPLYDEINDN